MKLRFGLRAYFMPLTMAAALAVAPAHAFDLQGHRGARGWMPENILPAFEHALRTGVDTLELDIGVSADGVVVVGHDARLNPAITRNSDGSWLDPASAPLVKSLTAEQLQRFDVGRILPGTPYAATFSTQQGLDGVRMPTLRQVFERVRALGADHVRFKIETRISPARADDTVSADAMAFALLKAINDAGMVSRVSIQSFDWRTLKRVESLDPRIPTVYLTVQNAANPLAGNLVDGLWTGGLRLADFENAATMVKAAGAKVWSPNFSALTQALVQQAQALGLKVIPWTVNAMADIDRLIAWGVDGIISDYPDRVRDVMAQRGLPLPKAVAATEVRQPH